MLEPLPDWGSPPEALSLAPDELHVWRAMLDADPLAPIYLERLLSPDERERAARFVSPRHRSRFIVARALLRHLLASYLQTSPAALRFVYSPYGKPALATPCQEVQFNVTHSDGLVLYAVTRIGDVGVDAERVRRMVDVSRIAEQFFSPRERHALRLLPEDAQLLAFFRCWTRKEAFLKATGHGLSHRLDSFDVSLAPGEPTALLSPDEAQASGRQWALYSFEPGDGYVGAVVVEATAARLRLFELAGHPLE